MMSCGGLTRCLPGSGRLPRLKRHALPHLTSLAEGRDNSVLGTPCRDRNVAVEGNAAPLGAEASEPPAELIHRA